MLALKIDKLEGTVKDLKSQVSGLQLVNRQAENKVSARHAN
jgi:hypothetical protein